MMMMTEAQHDQRKQALQKANRVRGARAEIKRQLHENELTLADLLEDPPAAVARVSIGELLEWLPGIGAWRAHRILAPGPGSPGIGRSVAIMHLSNASKGRIVSRHEEIRPFRYAVAAA